MSIHANVIIFHRDVFGKVEIMASSHFFLWQFPLNDKSTTKYTNNSWDKHLLKTFNTLYTIQLHWVIGLVSVFILLKTWLYITYSTITLGDWVSPCFYFIILLKTLGWICRYLKNLVVLWAKKKIQNGHSQPSLSQGISKYMVSY